MTSAGLWGTRQTEDTTADRELYIRTTIRELIIYVFFIVTLCVCELRGVGKKLLKKKKYFENFFFAGVEFKTDYTFKGFSTSSGSAHKLLPPSQSSSALV